ncbi:sigma-70 family RNA polymerase sigma factor [Cystobacter fuscus]|uniref:sigma-70 family RNA polymerase sigma factor n=1 Tax=Cystobacter fuscus TaxID=43 RepID=UPI002B2B8809|nr:sigma-70 family RNA polymerase sigma factor [Cystobacter fuscus]
MLALDNAGLAELFEHWSRAHPGSAEERQVSEQLIRRIGPQVLKLCTLYTRTRIEAEDLFQETFLQLLMLARKASPPPLHFGAYVAGMVRNLAQHMHRDNSRTETFSADEHGQTTAAFERQLEAQLDTVRYMQMLPERMRHVVRACLIDGHSTEEVAGELGTTPENVRQIRSRAVRMLRDLDVQVPEIIGES